MSQIKEVKDATDIVQIIGERIQLQRSGSQLKGLCPFHSEKSPSFFVNEQFQRYKCFGCGEHGDALTFLEKYEGMTFGEALEYLAERAGITLTSYQPTQEDDQRRRLLEILNLAKEYYHYLLTKHELGEPGRLYLKQRGVTTESIRLFQLGYALPSWEGLIAYLHKKKKYSLDDIQAAGLSVTGKRGGGYDRFRDRLMFPLTNHRGQVVGFSGRLMAKEAKEAKYINSPETQLYHKSQMLFGYSELLQEIRKKKEVVVVEGEFDVISSAQAHVNNVVAIKGSALTLQHLQLIKRVAEKVIFSLDMDSAGVTATKRAIQLARDFGLDMRVISLPSGKDPDELARTEPAAWREAVKSSISVYEFLIRAAAKQFNPKTPEGKRAIINDLAPIIGTMSHAVEQEVYLKKLSDLLAVREESVRQDIERFKQTGVIAKSKPEVKGKADQPAEPSRPHKLEQFLWFLFFHSAPNVAAERLAKLAEVDLILPGSHGLLKALQDSPKPFDLDKAVKALPSDLQELVFELSAQPEYLDMLDTLDQVGEWQRTYRDIFEEKVKNRIAAMNTELTALDKTGQLTPEQEARQNMLLQEIVGLRKQLSSKSQS